MIDRVIDFDNMFDAYQKTLSGTAQYCQDAVLFKKDETYNLLELQQSLIHKTYQHGDYNSFYVYEPKKRHILAPQFKDKIVQHALNNVLRDVYEKHFIHDSYACIRHKGNRNAVKRLQYFYRSAYNRYNDPYVVNVDVLKFFYSIDRNILKKIFRKKIACPETLWLLDTIVDSYQDEKYGLPLGNLSSQLFANILMNEIDQHAKHELKMRYYLRYADDIFIIVDGKEQANLVKEYLFEFSKLILNMEMHPKKSTVYPLKQGINGLGFIIHAHKIRCKTDTVKRFKAKIKKLPVNLERGHISIYQAESMINSWFNHYAQSNNMNFIKHILMKYPFIKVYTKDTINGIKAHFYIDEDILNQFNYSSNG